jgi:hypothetical protein
MDQVILFQENKVEVRRRLKDGRIDYLVSIRKPLFLGEGILDRIII